MKSLALIAIITLFVTPSHSQGITRNNIYLEIGGASFFYSVNYERLLSKYSDENLSVRLGFMYINTFNEQEREIYSIPVSISYLIKLKKNYLEIGISGSIINDKYNSFNQSGGSYEIKEMWFMPSIRAGIRHQANSKGFFWNTLFQYSLIAGADQEGKFTQEEFTIPFISIGLGHSF